MPTFAEHFAKLLDNPFLSLFFSKGGTNMIRNEYSNAGHYNLKVGRDPDVVARECSTLAREHNLTWLGVCEAKQYGTALRGIAGYHYFTFGPTEAGKNAGILVRKDAAYHNPSVVTLSTHAWPKWHGPGYHKGRKAPFLIINGIGVMEIHMPPGGPSQPQKDQEKSFRECSRTLVRFANNRRMALAYQGDFNVSAASQEPYGMRWVANTTNENMQVIGTGIDYLVTRGTRVRNMKRITDRRFGSDHDPIIYEIKKEN